ncbi:LIM domain only protein 7 isoform X2 [Gasterosteus aculeatus]
MEWRQQTSVSCEEAFGEAQRWIQDVTGKSFGSNDFRAALENGVLLCDLINCLKPGIIKRVNRLSTPIAGLDNVNVFLKACGKVGLNVSQLFHPGDLQDLSTRATLRQDESDRRLKNVLVTIYWLGRKAHLDSFYTGPQLNFKAFEGLLGLALSKALDEGWYPEREECRGLRPSYGWAKSVDNIDSRDFRTRPNSEGCGSDAEAEQVFKMETTKQNKGNGFIPPLPPRRKQGREEMGSPLSRTYQIQVRPERPVQVNPGWIWSKSLSDIPMVYPVRKVPGGTTIYDLDHECGLETKRKCSVAAKDSEAQWHDDLMKWKNRRRSTKSDLRKKSQEWDQVINQMAIGAMNRFEKKEAQGGLPRDQQSPRRHHASPRPYSTSPPSKSSSCNLRPHTRALLACSDSTEAPFSSRSPLGTYNSVRASGSPFGAMPAADGKTYSASLASDGARVTTPSLDFPFSSQTQVKAQCSPAPLQPTTQMAGVAELEDSALEKHASQTECQKTSMAPAVQQAAGQPVAGVYKYLSRTGSWSGSASLPRGYRRSEGSSRLSSTMAPRPFGTRQSSVSSLQRRCSVDNNSEGRLLKSEKEETFSPTAKSSLKRQNATAHLKGQHPASIRPKEANQAKQSGTAQTGEVKGATLSSKTDAYNSQPYSQTKLAPRPYTNPQSRATKGLTRPSNASNDHTKVDHSDMRVSLTLKPNSVPDFGIQTHWGSTGARVKYVQPGSPAELCQLCVDDEIVAVNGVAAALMNCKQWKDEMTSSLRTGNLTMDVRRYGNKDWSTSEGITPNQPGQSRMTLNLTAAAPVVIGGSDHHANSCAATETTVRKMSKLNGQADNVAHGKVMHGELADNHKTARSKDCNNIGSKNQKKRAEFFKLKGGSESAISDLKVPSLSPSSSSWSWDREEDRRRQEKWQEDQERLLQAQYQRDQERLELEWQRAQQDAKQELCRNTGTSFEMTGGGERPASSQIYVNGLTNKTRKEQSPARDEPHEAGSKPQSNAQGERHDKNSEHAWAEDSCGFAQLSPAHRAKSWSTPALAGPYKPGIGDERKKRGPSVSNAEKDRKQILEEMKKRTQLLTDNSWIRQRSSSFYKEPIYVGVPMKRYESLDDLDALRLSTLSTATFSCPRPHSAAAGYRAPTRNASSRYSTGTMLSHRNEFDGVWAATNISEELRLEFMKPEAPL